MTSGPFLYDEGPAPLHTGTPRRRPWLLFAVFGGTAIVAVLMVVLLPVIKGSPEEQAREVVSVFLAALDGGDTETAHHLLCEDERARLAPAEVAGAYSGGEGAATLGTVAETEVAGEPAREVPVEWADGEQARVVVVNADGPRVCGLTTGD
jgi:hypothetical protein